MSWLSHQTAPQASEKYRELLPVTRSTTFDGIVTGTDCYSASGWWKPNGVHNPLPGLGSLLIRNLFLTPILTGVEFQVSSSLMIYCELRIYIVNCESRCFLVPNFGFIIKLEHSKDASQNWNGSWKFVGVVGVKRLSRVV